MKISLTYGDDGHFAAAQEVTTAGRLAVQLIAGPGQHHVVLDAPSHHNGKAFSDVIHHLKVAKVSGAASLVDR